MRFLRILINWTIVFTMPIWCGSVLFLLFMVDVITNNNKSPRKIMSGKDWIWRNL